MCGIAGFTHSRPPADGRISAIARSIAHRGPDQQGVWESDRVSLGAVRLKIIDLDHGAQPMIADDTVLVFNGEIYNHAEVRRELEQRGHRFASRCDTEVVLRAFLEWDVESFAKLRGMFAAALWNQSRKRLLLARDRMGIKPLYYSLRGGEIYFGSELKTILLHPEIERRIDPFGLDRFLAMNYAAGSHTLIEGIEKLAPGHWLEWRDGAVRSEAYWRLEFRPDPRIDLESAKSELDRLLRASVREHLISDVPLGVWSSGGLDSSTILHYAAEAAGAKLKTFSVSFRGREFDESDYFREVAAKYATDHHEFDLSPDRNIAEAIGQFACYCDEPSADAGALPVWFLSKMCRAEVTVALSGDGADELFGGYNTYLADRYARLLRRWPRPLRQAASAAARLLPVSDKKIGFDYKITRMLAGSLLDPVDAHFFWNGTFTPDQRRALAGVPAQPVTFPETGEGDLNRFLRLDQLNYLPDDILNKVDRMSMAHSLEVRPPFLDHRIVEFAAALPENLKIRGSKLKFVLRELMRGRLPRAVTSRSKEGFDIPAHAWLRSVLRPLLVETLCEKNVRDSGMLAWEPVRGLLEAHLQRRANFGYHLWGLLILLLWTKYWRVGPPSEERARRPEMISAVR